MTIVVLYHDARYRYFNNYYNGVVLTRLKPALPGLPSAERFLALQPRIFIPRLMFLASRWGKRTGIDYLDATALAVCHHRRIARHQLCAGLAARGKSSLGWCCGCKRPLVFNHPHELVARKLTPGHVSDPAPVISLVKGLTGKLFGDQGYIGKELSQHDGTSQTGNRTGRRCAPARGTGPARRSNPQPARCRRRREVGCHLRQRPGET